MNSLVSYEVNRGVAVLTLTNPPVNALSSTVSKLLHSHVETADNDVSVKAIVLMGSGATFSGGADITEFSQLRADGPVTTGPLGVVIERVEASSKPVVAALHGSALGGGLELAMGCHYRVAATGSRVGLPEVKLGLIPGATGTQRLPRLAGVTKAAEICATGDMMSVEEAAEAGIIDEVTDDVLKDAAISFALKQADSDTPVRRTSTNQSSFGDPAEYNESIAELKKVVARRSPRQTAPLKAIEAVCLAATTPFSEGVKRELEIFGECLRSDQSQGLISVFFGERTVGKIPGITKETPRRSIECAAVVGAGTMGGGITMTYVNAGIPVVLKEIDQEQLDNGLARIRQNYEVSVKRGKMTQENVEKRMAMITPTVDYGDLANADIIVEAAFEGMQLKKEIFAELDRVAKPTAILASNTSTLDIDAIASVTKRPESVIGHHFFSPANIMRLLEIVRGRETADDVIATSMDLAKRLRKIGVLVGNCFGFVANRMFFPYLREAQFVLEEGATVEQVDQAHMKFGMAMGPHLVGDLAGIDVTWRITQETKDSVPEGMRQPLVADKLYEMDRYGQKTGAGWYKYDGRRPVADPVVQELIEKSAAEAGIEQREISDEEIVERTILAMVNEGAKILEEGIALRAIDLDIVYVCGYGFPPWRGGPMKYADTLGLRHVYDRICHYHKTQGFWWEPAPLLKKLVEEGSTFSEWTA